VSVCTWFARRNRGLRDAVKPSGDGRLAVLLCTATRMTSDLHIKTVSNVRSVIELQKPKQASCEQQEQLKRQPVHQACPLHQQLSEYSEYTSRHSRPWQYCPSTCTWPAQKISTLMHQIVTVQGKMNHRYPRHGSHECQYGTYS
jgi:hypothetical protein